MKYKSIIMSMLATVAFTFTLSSCNSEEKDPNSFYSWSLASGKTEITKTTQSSGLFEKWVNDKISELIDKYCGDGSFLTDAEAEAYAQVLNKALEQAVQEFETLKNETDLGEGSCTLEKMVELSKEGNVIKTYPSVTFDYYEPIRYIYKKAVKKADLDAHSQISISLDKFGLGEVIALHGISSTQVYTENDNKRIDFSTLVKDISIKGESIIWTFQDLTDKKGKYSILIPFASKDNETVPVCKICLYLDLN